MTNLTYLKVHHLQNVLLVSVFMDLFLDLVYV